MEITQKVVVLVGGVGGAKLALGLSKLLPAENLTIIVNTGDDFWHYGLRICPDLDTLMYTLSGWVDPVNGWGLADDTTAALDMLKQYGEEPWFRLGDKDIATHLLRTKLLRDGCSLTQVTRRLADSLGIRHSLLPMTDSTVSTMVDTVEYGELEFQEYFVRYRWQPVVKGLRFAGNENAQIGEEVRSALMLADVILIAPSNPWLSIAPILSLPGMRELLISRDVPRVAVTPLIGGRAVKGPTAKLMLELGLRVSAETIAEVYRSILNGFVFDIQDGATLLPGLRTVALNTLMQTEADKIQLATTVLNWIQGWSL